MSLPIDCYNNQLALQFNDSVSSVVSKICEPLFNNFGLTLFTYSHFLNNGAYLDICTNIKWQEHYLKIFAHKSFVKIYIKKIFENNTKYVLWGNKDDTSKGEDFSRLLADREKHNIHHGFTIYKKHTDSLEAWHFATTKENYEIINFYLNRLDLLYHFILYFADRAGKIIDISDPQKLVFFEDRSPLNDFQKEPLCQNTNQDFMSQTEVKRFSISTNTGVIFISRREVECMRHLSTSKTVKEIAREMDLSPRTVESYLKNIKNKLSCSNKLELINLFKKNDIQHL